MMRHKFIFPIATLKEEVEKRTSKLGQMRSTDEAPHLLERLSLTEGESFLTDEYLDEAAAETYDWIKAFGRNVKNAYRVYPNGVLKEVVEDEGAKVSRNLSPILFYTAEQKPNYQMYSDDAGSYFDLERYEAIDDEGTRWGWKAGTMELYSTVYPIVEGSALYKNSDGIQAGVAHLDYAPVAGKKTYVITGSFEDIVVETGIAQYVDVKFSVFWRRGVEEAPFEDLMQEVVLRRYEEDETMSVFSFEVELEEDPQFGWETIAGVDNAQVVITHIEPAQRVDIHRGDYVKYTNLEGVVLYGVSTGEGKDPLWVEEWLEEDFRNSIVFRVELPDWSDENMLPSVQRNLKEALVDYILYKWLEVVYPKEADTYYEHFEDKAHKAQLGLNTEKRVLQRGSLWLH